MIFQISYQLILSQPRGQIMSPTFEIAHLPPNFQTFRHAWYIPYIQLNLMLSMTTPHVLLRPKWYSLFTKNLYEDLSRCCIFLYLLWTFRVVTRRDYDNQFSDCRLFTMHAWKNVCSTCVLKQFLRKDGVLTGSKIGSVLNLCRASQRNQNIICLVKVSLVLIKVAIVV